MKPISNRAKTFEQQFISSVVEQRRTILVAGVNTLAASVYASRPEIIREEEAAAEVAVQNWTSTNTGPAGIKVSGTTEQEHLVEIRQEVDDALGSAA